MQLKPKYILGIALFIAVVVHGTVLLFNMGKTYDAYVHLFFADHYVRSWWDPWEYRWYTGFPTTSYPPLSHMLMALVSKLIGLRLAFVSVMLTTLAFFVYGVYRFSRVFVDKRSAALAALYGALASSIIQTTHIYGQLPTMMGITALLYALPVLYNFIIKNDKRSFWLAMSILAVGIASHHVTTIFGMVFFIAPMVATALLDRIDLSKPIGQNIKDFFSEAWKKKWPITWVVFTIIFLVIFVIFPYWYWSKTDPISQVPIPHGSRENFIAKPEMGIMFFVIPWGFTLLVIPYVLKALGNKRNIFFLLSFVLLFILGTGGTTPIPRLLLGDNAFNILTLDRFTFWASILSLPFAGEFFSKLLNGEIRTYLEERFGSKGFYSFSFMLESLFVIQAFLLLNYHQLTNLQPDPIDIKPIVTFLERDQHYKWRYITLGFGDQMAWLSANTSALSIDGNYHSARRIPAMTSKPLERLENSKFKGIQGIGSLQQFLTNSQKYHLKFVFSNDKFYDPILHFSGWERLSRLENGIMVWQKPNIKPLPALLPRNDIPKAHRIMWGSVPIATPIILLLLLLGYRIRGYVEPNHVMTENAVILNRRDRSGFVAWIVLMIGFSLFLFLKKLLYNPQLNPTETIEAYYDALNERNFEKAYSYFIPNELDYDNYLLQNSVKDGIISSYGSLDSLKVNLTPHQDTYEANVDAYYNTPLESYHQQFFHRLAKVGKHWYVEPPKFDNTLVPSRVFTKSGMRIHSQGKRKLMTNIVDHDDILDRPKVRVLSSRLVQDGQTYKVIGEIQNVDNLPAHLTTTARLFDEDENELVKYNARYTIKHVLLPEEITPFLIEFEQTAWAENDDPDPTHFDPKEFTPFQFESKPVEFILSISTLIADNNYFSDVGITNVQAGNNAVSGRVYNASTDDVTILQLLTSYYDDDNYILWVDHKFLPDAIRPQRWEDFEIKVPKLNHLKTIDFTTNKNILINNFYQRDLLYSSEMNPADRVLWQSDSQKKYMITPNGYIANPTLY